MFKTDCNIDLNASGAEAFSVKMGIREQGYVRRFALFQLLIRKKQKNNV